MLPLKLISVGKYILKIQWEIPCFNTFFLTKQQTFFLMILGKILIIKKDAFKIDFGPWEVSQQEN